MNTPRKPWFSLRSVAFIYSKPAFDPEVPPLWCKPSVQFKISALFGFWVKSELSNLIYDADQWTMAWSIVEQIVDQQEHFGKDIVSEMISIIVFVEFYPPLFANEVVNWSSVRRLALSRCTGPAVELVGPTSLDDTFKMDHRMKVLVCSMLGICSFK